MTEVRGTVPVGRYVLTLGSAHGTTLALGEGSDSSSRTAVARALGEPQPAAVERLEAFVEESAAVAGRAERALELFTAVATGRILDRGMIAKEVDALVDLLERLDRAGRFEDALRLAQALSGLLALLLRWAALVQTLRIALRAGRALAANVDDAWTLDEAWARHELGTLGAGADSPDATAQLEDALRLRERIHDRAGAETTAVNLDVVRAASERGQRDPHPRWLLVVAGLAALVLLSAAGVAISLALDDDGSDAVTTTADSGTTTTEPTTDAPPPPGPAEFIARPDELTSSTDATFDFTADGASGFECSLDAEGFSGCGPPLVYNDLSGGPHSFDVRGVNSTGAGEPARADWTIDVTPPTATVDDVSDEGDAYRFAFSVDEPATFECWVDDEDAEACDPATGFEWLDPPPRGGEHLFQVRATDEAGNIGDVAARSFGGVA